MVFFVKLKISDTLREVTQYAIFPGCEKFMGDNNKLNSCFGEQLRILFENKSFSLQDKYEKKYKPKKQNPKSEIRISAIIDFSVTKTGKLEVVRLREGSDEELGKDASDILNVLFDSLIVEPAQLSDGTPVSLALHIPITLILD